MFQDQITRTGPEEFIRCGDSSQPMSEAGVDSRKETKADISLANAVNHALWTDDVLRAIEYDQIDVHIRNGVVHLTGHIVNTASQNRIMIAARSVPGILVIHNHLILDEKLTVQVATSLGALEHTYDCKFFTGASHGVVSLNGVVNNEEVKMLAEKRVASNPHVRGVINNVRVSGSVTELQDEPFLQPTEGETIYFLNGISGIVKQVIINPNNRRVTAMTIQGNFDGQRNELHSLVDGKTKPPEQRIVVPMNVVRYMTKVSGFLYINSNDRDQYQVFEPTSFYKPNLDWVPPYPYCLEDVLFSVKYQSEDVQLEYGPRQFPYKETLEGASFKEQFFANDSLSG